MDLGGGRQRLGGSALAQVYGQIGEVSPDVEDSELLARAFNTAQSLIEDGIVTAGHDRSDGGLVTTLLEMAFAGNCGIDIGSDGEATTDPLALLFAEELGLVLEVGGGRRGGRPRGLCAGSRCPARRSAELVGEPSIGIQVGDQRCSPPTCVTSATSGRRPASDSTGSRPTRSLSSRSARASAIAPAPIRSAL